MFNRTLLAASVSLVLTGLAQAADNTATVDQIGAANKVESFQAAGSANALSFAQDGDLNIATSSQVGSELTLTAAQSGTANDMTVLQMGYDAEANLSQEGSSNVTRVFQATDEGSHYIEVAQIGSDNVALVTQGGGEGSGQGHHGVISQEGQDNVIDLQQSWYFNSIRAEQYGDANVTRAAQGGGFVSADTYQSGTSNTIDLNQSGFEGAQTSISQTGTDNEASIYQTGGGRYSGGNVALTQNGDRNVAEIADHSAWGMLTFTQTGSDNVLAAEQSGRSNRVIGESNGERNQVDIQQDGDGNSLDIAQNGSDNIIEASQNSTLASGDVGIIDQTGTANYALLTQGVYGSGVGTDTATIMQNGSYNSATVTQR